jgi:hypothetical protein
VEGTWICRLQKLKNALSRASWAILVGVQKTRILAEMLLITTTLKRFQTGLEAIHVIFWERLSTFFSCSETLWEAEIKHNEFGKGNFKIS